MFNAAAAEETGLQGTSNVKRIGSSDQGQGGGDQQKGGQGQRPSPEQVAKDLMSKFDADKDGVLSKGELTQALEALHKRRAQERGKGGKQGGGKGGQGGGSAEASQGGGKAGGQGGSEGHGKKGGEGQSQGGGQQAAEQGGQGGQHQGPPPPERVAERMIEKFSSDKKGLTQAELAKGLEDLHANRPKRGGDRGGQGGSEGQGQSSSKRQGPPPEDESK